MAVGGSVVAAALEAGGLLLLLPLVQLLTAATDTIPSSDRWLADFFGNPSAQRLAAYLAGIAFLAFMLKGLLSLLLLRWNLGFILRMESEMGRRLLEAYLYAPYIFHLTRSSAEVQRTVHDDVRRVFEDAAVALVGGAADAVVIVAIALVLLVIKPIVALCAVVYFVGVGIGYQRLIHGRANEAGESIHHELVAAYRTVQQSVGAIKVVKLRNKEAYFSDELFNAKQRAAGRMRTIILLYQAPRYYLETAMILGVGFMAAVSYEVLPTNEATAVLGLFLAAGFRLLPSLNRVLVAHTAVRAGLPSLEAISADILALQAYKRDDEGSEMVEPLVPGRIEMHHVSFRYSDAARPVLRDVSLTIEPGESVAIVGSSGAGKSTLLDLLLGLLTPTEGSISIGGRPLLEVRARWQRSIGYVPQDVVLLDDSIRGNIAFGDMADVIDDRRVALASSGAELDGFLRDLPAGLETGVEERGIRLSGGQRQRVGIARALYADPSTLILDEATSALDVDTEHRIADTIQTLQGNLTIITVTHRLNTVQMCDRIYFLEDGGVAAVGTFAELLESSTSFRDLVHLAAMSDDGRRSAPPSERSAQDAPTSR